MLTARETMDVVAAFRDVGTYRGAAEICGVDPKTVKRKVLAHEAGALSEQRAVRAPVAKNTDVARDLVAQRVEKTNAKVTAKRLLVEARAVGYVGSGRNFRRLVAAEKKQWRSANGRQRRPAVWTPGDMLVIDWGSIPGTGISVFCAVLAWSRIRFVRYARDETAATTFAMLAECFETLGGVPAKVLARPDGLSQGGHGCWGGDPDTGLCAVRHSLRVLPGLLSSGGPSVERDRREPGRLRQTRYCCSRHRRRSGVLESGGRRLVCGTQQR